MDNHGGQPMKKEPRDLICLQIFIKIITEKTHNRYRVESVANL
jgi:hypothetical protein